MSETEPNIGYVIGGGLKASLQARLTVPAEKVQEGGFVIMETEEWLFYGLVTDIMLGATDPRFADEQSENRLPPQISRLLYQQALYTNLEVLPTLMLERGPDLGSPKYEAWRKEHPDGATPIPVKTIPPQHTPVRLASAGDIAEVFKGNFVIGYTREQGHPVQIDLERLVKRSSGIFGATGTGKSFLTRMVLAGLIHHSSTAVLIFDMHNEYGPDDIAADTGQKVLGLRGQLPQKVRMVGLGAGATIRGQQPDFTLELAESDIMPEDIEMLTRELNLRETTPATLSALVHCFGPTRWFAEFRQMTTNDYIEDDNGKKIPAPGSVQAWAAQNNVNELAAVGLRGKLERVFNLPYIVERPAADSLKKVIDSLESGMNIILSFGDHEADLDYLLVTNILTRKIRRLWEERTNQYRSHPQQHKEPRPLVIVIEEAHKLLNREMAGQTAFSAIAREMRKYGVTLLIIDQRPSQIYDEVMSQLGTRITGWLGDEEDIHAVLSGLAGRDALRGMLSRLQPKEEVLLLGWGVPTPIPVRTRRYNDEFWRALKGRDKVVTTNDLISRLGGDE
ncbi:MAG TPA: ATP-binding protein [Anaerolineaceae bacterium]|nr:ATP-binding protein [Anaerolineaceae bacterium]HPN51248.1 ATP-binding protein [Anaerolineaceae bacterium]